MEIHYDNRYYRDDIVDSSGLRLWFTEETREYDAGIISTGLNPAIVGQFIPPGLYISNIRDKFCFYVQKDRIYTYHTRS